MKTINKLLALSLYFRHFPIAAKRLDVLSCLTDGQKKKNLFNIKTFTAGEDGTSQDNFHLFMCNDDKLVALFPIIIHSCLVCGEYEAD